MKERPIDKPRFNDYRARLQRQSPIHGIDALFEMQCEMLVAAYHGGTIRAGAHLIAKGVAAICRRAYRNAVYGICDRVGWTQLREFPDAPGCFERHGGHCDKMNCQDIDCVQRGIPQWYKTITRMPRFD